MHYVSYVEKVENMRKKKKRGRPALPKGEKKRHIIAFKIDDAEMKALDRKARELKLSRSEVIREGMKRILRD
jgi:hypothetical protein